VDRVLRESERCNENL